MPMLLSADFFSKLTFSKNSFKNTIRVSNALDPDHAQGYKTVVFFILNSTKHEI